jgi:hypothetical protein
MSELSTEFVVAAPADAVWNVIGRRFDRIGEWATAIPASTALPPSARTITVQATPQLPVGQIVAGAPVAGRVCTTGVRLVPRVTETLVEYDETNRTLTYEASGMPAFVTTARNTWTVVALDERRCRVILRARFVARGLLGHLGRWVILAQVGRTSRYLADDLRHYVETGRPSARKQRQLRRAARRAARSAGRSRHPVLDVPAENSRPGFATGSPNQVRRCARRGPGLGRDRLRRR